MKVIIFALDDLYGNNSKFEISNEQLSDVYYKFNKMYLSIYMDSVLETMYRELQVFENYICLSIVIDN